MAFPGSTFLEDGVWAAAPSSDSVYPADKTTFWNFGMQSSGPGQSHRHSRRKSLEKLTSDPGSERGDAIKISAFRHN